MCCSAAQLFFEEHPKDEDDFVRVMLFPGPVLNEPLDSKPRMGYHEDHGEIYFLDDS